MKPLAAAVLSAYLAMTGMTPDLSRLPTSNPSAQSASQSTETAKLNRRRSVPHATPPSHLFFNVAATDDLRYTNHDTKDNTIRACIERTNQCITDVVAPGASVTRTAALGQDKATLELYTTGPAELRSTNDALPTTLLTTERQNIPVMGADQVFRVYTQSPGTAEIAYLMSNGVERDRETIALVPGTNTLSPRPLAVGEQLDLIPNNPTIMTALVNGVLHRAKTRTEALGTHYLVGADTTTTVTGKNVDPTAVLNYETIALATDGTSLVKHWNAVNWGTRTATDIATTLSNVQVNGTYIDGVNFTPMHIWSNILPQTVGATAKNAFGVGNNLKNLSLNQLPDTLILNSTQNDATYTINGYNDNGEHTGTMTGSATQRATPVDITSLKATGATRLELIAHDAINGQTGQNNILLGATINNINKGGYQTEKPAVVEPQPEYDIVTKIYVRNNNQTFIQTTHPSANTVKKILGFEPDINTLDPLLGLKQYACENLPDPIVNSVPEIVANYLSLTPAEQHEFSGDVDGWKPFIYYNHPNTTIVDPCNTADPDGKFTYMITVDIARK